MAIRTIILLFVALSASATPTYVGAASCGKCHPDALKKWAASRHSKMVQPATAEAVQGDFSRGPIQLQGGIYRVRQDRGAYFITESELNGKPVEYRIDYTLGNRRIQHYLTTLASGRIVLLAPSWDIVGKHWFHNLEIADPYQSGDLHTAQVWNRNCYSCHVSREEKNFDVEKDSYKTSWIDFGTNCERCHGPGSDHIAFYSQATSSSSNKPRDIVLQTRLDSQRNTMVCAQCHSLRDIYVDGFVAGSNYYDYFVPIIEFSQPLDRDPSYWPDGRTRRFSNDALGFWQSECFLKGGATCLNCHSDAHDTGIERNPQLRPDSNALCMRCHAAIGEKLVEHTHHRAESAASSCVECHMPRTVFSIKAAIRDHSISVPVPENTIRHAIPNACNACHQERDARWALAQMNQWYGTDSRQKWIRRADAFAAARAGDPASIAVLVRMFGEAAEGPLARANAVGYLGKFSFDPIAFAALKRSLADPEPLVRTVGALEMHPGPADKEEAIGALRRSLDDRVTVVRLAAAVSLLSLGVSELPDEDGRRFDTLKKLYEARAKLNADDPDQQVAAGRFYYLTGAFGKARDAFAAALMLEPSTPARYYLALTLVQQQKISEARAVLLEIPPGDPQYPQAQKLLNTIGEAK